MIPAWGHILLLSVGAVLTAALGSYAYRNRQEPGAMPFLVLMAVLSVWSAVYAVSLLMTDRFWRLFMLRVVWLVGGSLSVWLFLFAVSYTGHDEFISARSVAGLLVVPALVIAGVWTNQWHHLFWTEHAIVRTGGLVLINPSWGPLFWIEVVYTYLLVAVAAVLLLRLIYQSDYLYTDQSALLLVGIVTPLLANAADVFLLADRATVDPTPYAFTVTGLAFGYALFRRQLFDLVPATRQLGRNTAISQLDAGIVIVDNANRIVYCNAAAEEVLSCDAADAIGQNIELLVAESELDFDTEDALAEIERGDSVYEVRASPITDRRDQRIGNTLVVHDVTARKERERRLASQRDELETVNDLNAVLRGVNQALVSALSREEIERAVCDRVTDADLYRSACIADLATWTGDGDRWTVGGDGEEKPSPPAVDDIDDEEAASMVRPNDDGGTWTIVPLLYGRTVYGALGLYTDREHVSDRERSVLGELGETIGHAINAVENRQLLSAETVVALELECTDDSDPLVAVSERLNCVFELEGVVPASEAGPLAYIKVTGVDAESAQEALSEATAADVSLVRSDEADGLLEWLVTGDAVLGSLVDHGANVTEVRADGGRARYELDIAAESSVRTLVETLTEQFAETRVLSKRERTTDVDGQAALPAEHLEDLTDRQQEVLEAAFRAGYFNWPRDSDAETVAESLDISSPTLHSHLRKAQNSILTDIFDAGE